MKIVRFIYKNKIYYGVDKENKIYISDRTPYELEEFQNSIDYKKSIDMNNIKLLLPIEPSKIIGIAENYYKDAQIITKNYEPLIFLKAPNALTIGKMVKKPFNMKAWGESELCVVIGKKGKNISIKKALDYVLGYTLVNDVTIANINNRDHHLARSKSVDGFCPMAKFIETDFDYKNKTIYSYHNDILLREASTDKMIWNVEEIISNISQWMSLEAGDMILTGTPPRVIDRIYIKDGDRFRVEIESLGKMENKFYE